MRPKIVTYHGKQMPLKEVSRISGVSKELIRWRIKQGMTVDEAADKPKRKPKTTVERPCGVNDWHECLNCKFPKGCISLSSPAMAGEAASDYRYGDYDE